MDSDEEAAQTTADFVRNNKERRRSRLDDVSFDDDGKTRDSAGARASDRRRAVAARGPAGGRGVDRWAGQADSDEESHDGAARPPAKRARVGAPARRSPHFSSGGRDAADAIDVDDEPRGTPEVVEVDDSRARAPAPRAGRFRAPERRSTRRLEEPPAPPRRIPRRGEERVMLRCRRVYFGTALRRDVTVVFAPSCVTMEWRSDTSGLYIETRLAPSHMTSFDLYHGPARGAGGDGEANPINLADDDELAPDAIREFFAIGLRQKPPHLRSVEGFEPSDDAGPRKYVVVVLDGEALATFKREAVPAVVWGGHVGWPAAPVLGTAAAARPFLEGIPIADALAAADDAEEAAALRRKPSRAAPAGPPVGDFVIPPPRQSYLRRAPDDDAVPAAPPVRPRLKKARGATTSSAPPRAPKAKSTKPLKGFMLFSKEMRPRVKADDPDLTFGGIGKRLGEIWRGLSDAEKARYNK